MNANEIQTYILDTEVAFDHFRDAQKGTRDGMKVEKSKTALKEQEEKLNSRVQFIKQNMTTFNPYLRSYHNFMHLL